MRERESAQLSFADAAVAELGGRRTQATLDQLDTAIWTFREDSFVPHGHEGDPAKQPVWLTVEGGNPNGAQALFLVDDAEPGDISGFERACLIFDGGDPTALESARSRWKQAKESGIAASYWKESAAGRWEKQQ